MDLASLIGIVGGIVLLIFGIVIGDSGVNFGLMENFVDFNSVLITIGGTLTSTITSNSIQDFVNGFKSIRLIFKTPVLNVRSSIRQIIELSNVARKEGLLALEEVAQEIEDPFMKKGILLIVDGTDPELVKGILETELNCMEERHERVTAFWDVMAAMGPAWGMIGTLIGLINMLEGLDDPTTVGPAMAVALVTTFYGSVIANWMAIPISNKLKQNNEMEVQLRSVMIEGLLSIQAGENPRVIEEKLKSFLAPGARDTMNEDVEGGE